MQKKVCHICGGAAHTHTMKTCCQCKKMTMHMHCFASVSYPVPEDWVCIDCSGGSDNNALACKTSDAGKMLFESSKVKFLSAEEAISLTPGATPKATKRSRFSNFGDTQEKASQRRNLCPPKPPLLANITKTTDANVELLLPKFSTRPAPHLTRTRYGPSSGGFQPKAVEPAEKNIDSGIYSSSEDNITLLDGPKERNTEDIRPLSLSFPRRTEEEGCHRQLRLPMNPHVEYQNEPVAEACWRGTFDAFNAEFRVDCGMEAHFAQSILSKAYEFSKQIPKNLELKIVPRLHAWPKTFLLEPPESGDIGLYFLPTEVKRSQEMYSTLLEYLDLRDFALQCFLGNVELLVYTSTQLPEYSRGSASGAYLFAIFRHIKKKKVSHVIKKDLAADTPLSSGNQLANSLERRSHHEAHVVHRRTLDVPDDQLDVPPGFESWTPQAKNGKRPVLLSPLGKGVDGQLNYRSPGESRVVRVKEEFDGQSSSTQLRDINTKASCKFVTVKTERED